jgi:hypothetical protein
MYILVLINYLAFYPCVPSCFWSMHAHTEPKHPALAVSSGLVSAQSRNGLAEGGKRGGEEEERKMRGGREEEGREEEERKKREGVAP